LSIYQEILKEGILTVRIFGLRGAGKTVESAQRLIDDLGPYAKPYISTGNDKLIPGGVKMFLDGSGGARTAWLYNDWNKDYNDIDKGNKGYPVIDPEIARNQILMFHNAGLHVSVHAIGDKAIDWIVDSYALALKEKPIFGLRHGIIHCNIPTEHALNTMADLQKNHDAVYPESQANFTWWIGDTYAGNFGPERSLRLNPFNTYVDRGIKWGGGSDYGVTPFAARFGLRTSIARQPLKGSYGANPFGSKESIDIFTALKSYTIWNARQLFLEDKIGSIEVGKYADIAIWNKNLYTIPTNELKDMKCLMTLFEGKIVHQAPESLITISKTSK
jgi:predicted amidohydrolase YtcJ